VDQSTLAPRNSSLLKNHRVHTEWQWPFDGKISPVWWGWGVHAHPPLLYLKSRTKLQCTLQLSRQIHSTYFYSTPVCTLWLKHRTELDGRNQDGGNIHKNVFFFFMVSGLAFVVGDGGGLDLLVQRVEDLVLLVPKTFKPLNWTVFPWTFTYCNTSLTWTFTLIIVQLIPEHLYL
jgi:hypothetical protein